MFIHISVSLFKTILYQQMSILKTKQNLHFKLDLAGYIVDTGLLDNQATWLSTLSISKIMINLTEQNMAK